MYKYKKEFPLLSFLLFLITITLFWQSVYFDFLNFDDDVYITQNKRVLLGFSVNNALATFYEKFGGHYHPITWISHIVDNSIWGMSPFHLHLQNILLHAVNVLLVFVLSRLILTNQFQAFTVALLWAVHPMRIESVVWLSERKDLLSMLFGMSSAILYIAWRKYSYHRFFIASLLTFLLSILSKPTFVTLPVLLILIDYIVFKITIQKSLNSKIIYFICSILLCLAALDSQQADGGLKSITSVGIIDRFSSAMINYLIYVGKLFAPLKIGIFYPFQIHHILIGVAALIINIIIGSAIFLNRKKSPYLWFGYCWYVITLLPMIGIIQIGGQSYADRWSYLPHIGILIGLVPSLWSRNFKINIIVVIFLSLYLSAVTFNNLPNWKNSISIFSHTLRVSPNNFMAHTNLGTALDTQGDLASASYHFEQAYKLNPTYPEALNNLGRLRASQRQFLEAKNFFESAVIRKPSFQVAKINLGLAFLELGEDAKAMEQWLEVLDLNSTSSSALQAVRYVLNVRKNDFCFQINSFDVNRRQAIMDKLQSHLGITALFCQ